MDQCWYVYMIEAGDGRLYTGITTDPERRLREHRSASRGAKFFNGREALAIRYLETCGSRSSALQREHQIKSLKRKEKLDLAANMTAWTMSDSGRYSPSED